VTADIVRQAGAVVYRTAHGGRAFLLVRARRTPGQWILPKGHLEAGESAAEAALREAREEAGVIGRIVQPLEPVLTFDFNGRTYQVTYFLVEATGATPEHEPREQTWLPADAALTAVTHDAARDLLRTAISFLSNR
jgi:8-oxo-dGTP pyrophosphatase MutT (NUDIX family)